MVCTGRAFRVVLANAAASRALVRTFSRRPVCASGSQARPSPPPAMADTFSAIWDGGAAGKRGPALTQYYLAAGRNT